MTSIEIPDSVTSIGDGAFSRTLLTSIVIPAGVTAIGQETFLDCEELTSITIPASVTAVGEDAFYGCYDLTEVNFLGSVDQWAQIEFKSYPSVSSENLNLYIDGELATDVVLTTATKISNSAFANCDSLKSIVIPNGVTSIGVGAFYNVWLTSVEIPDSVTSIGSNAFEACYNLSSVVIGKNVTIIGYCAFYACYDLRSITFNGTVAEWNAIEKDSMWIDGPINLYVQCTDGEVKI